MKKSRIIVLFLALAAAAAAFVVANGSRTAPSEIAAAPPPAPAPTDDVLVASKDLPLGTSIADSDFAWQSWPKDAVTPGMLRKSENPKIIDELKGSFVKVALTQGEPVHRDKLVKGANGGFMSVILSAGKRAVAINIDSQGATSAGGFILPNDHVDVIRTYHQEARSAVGASSGEGFVSETLLTNIKILAIGQNVQDKNGQPVVVGSNATLELDPAQAETVILGQRTGQLSLVLRSMLDANDKGESVRQATHSLSVVRYGSVTQDGSR